LIGNKEGSKLLVGLNLYGNNYANGQGDSIIGPRYLEILKNHDTAFEFDTESREHLLTYDEDGGKRHLVYYPTLLSLQERIDLVLEFRCGLMLV
jgi:chitinase domain-containing protein 1